MNVNGLRAFLIEWNAMFPLDRKYREKHGILFNSPEHRQVCQIDIYLSHLEDEVHAEILADAMEEYEKAQALSKGKLVRDVPVNTQAEEQLFDDLDISKIDFDNITIE